MKTIKQIISDADPRLKGVLVIMIVYVMVMATTVTSGATQEIKGYKETIEIQYQDGSQEAKDYLVRQDTVKNVLKELDVNLGTKDTVNKDMAYIVQSKDLLQVNRISEEEVEEIQYVDSQTIETTTKDATIAQVANIMVSKEFSGMPVSDDKNKVQGIVSKSDILRYVYDHSRKRGNY